MINLSHRNDVTSIVKRCMKSTSRRFTSHDVVTSVQLSTNCNLTVCIFESGHDIKNLTEDKLRSNPSKRCRRRYIWSEDSQSRQIFPKELAIILLGIPMDPILNFLERAEKERFQKLYVLTIVNTYERL